MCNSMAWVIHIPFALSLSKGRTSSRGSQKKNGASTSSARTEIFLRLRRGRGWGVAERPHPLEIVEAAHLGAEQVDDAVAGIDQHPVGGRQALDPRRAAEFALDLLGELGRHRGDLARRAAARDHHM